MASKRKGKEVEGSGSGAGKRQAAVRNHDVVFKYPERRDRYKILVSKPLSGCKYPDSGAMNTLGIRDNVVRLLTTLGWVEILRPMRGFENFTYEFLSSLSFTKDRSKSDNPNHRVYFWLLNVNYEMSLEHFCNDLGLTNAGYIDDSWDHTLRPADYDPVAFWKSITRLR